MARGLSPYGADDIDRRMAAQLKPEASTKGQVSTADPDNSAHVQGLGHDRDVEKDPVLQKLFQPRESSLRKYQRFFVGSDGISALLAFEFLTFCFGSLPGALGFMLRKQCYPLLFKKVGSSVLWGRSISLRHPGKIIIGERVAIDDGCLLDGKGTGEDTVQIQIGNDVMIARDTIIQAKTSWIFIGDRCTIGSQCQLSSAGGIKIGNSVMMSGQCYIGGGRYHTEDQQTPMMDQGLYSKGPVVIEDDVWLGAGVIVQDGVRIGKGSVVGAGAIVREDIPPFTIAAPHQRLVLLPRG